MSLSILSVRLPTGEQPICSITLEPYVVVKRADAGAAEELADEGQSDVQFSLRSRWFRSTISQGKALCAVHPDKEATVQCTVCLRSKVAQHLSFHCSVDCFKNNWNLHREYHQQSHTNGGTDIEVPSMSTFKGGGSTLSNGESWMEVSRSRKYTPSSDDVGFVLKYEVQMVDSLNPREGRALTAYTSRVRPAPNPPNRCLMPIGPGDSAAQAGRFTLLTYNLLADLYAKGDINGQPHSCPAWALSWQYRKRCLLKELLKYRPDIMCLQEVQSDHYADFLLPELSEQGYTAIYKKKTTEVYTNNTYAIDGCATFFRRDRFALVKKYEVEFNKAALSLAEQMSNPALRKQALNRLLKDNVALIAVLEAVEPLSVEAASRSRQLVCVANTHIHANPELSDVKLWQVHTLLKGLEKIAHSADIPMLVAGDFNSTPGSPAHSLLVNQKVVPGPDGSADPLNIFKRSDLQHTLPLASAYAALSTAQFGVDSRLAKQLTRVDSTYHEPLFTNVSKDFKGTLDYILYTRDSLVPTALLELPAESDVVSRPDEALPNASWSSDHLALMAEFTFTRA